ncbi:GTPase [Xylaria bambusicola]|uniref:GTPase n=1 Tax=Xylaria bambusicola TaxID=326684 RepID=UPI0020089E89|nr:GTPase [Xylaria bambusicola]KAI0518485.1 GTPase [Xylaria bambusicola]
MVPDHKMNSHAGLVGSLVERLTTRLPHRTGTHSSELKHDDIVTITRASIVKLSSTSISHILHALISLLEDVSRAYKSGHPSYILQSEIYIVALAADCCSAHWQALRDSSSSASPNASSVNSATQIPVLPKPLDDKLVKRVFSYLEVLIEPIPDGYVIPAKVILEDEFVREILDPRYDEPALSLASSSGSDTARDTINSREANDDLTAAEPYIKKIAEFVSAANWSASFDYVRSAIRSKRTTASTQSNSTQSLTMSEDDRSLLVTLKFLSYLWVDALKLGLVMQELSSTFLHFRRMFQNTVALVAPLLIFKWIERYPWEFVRLHSQRRKLDGGPDTLADMTHSLGDNGRRRSSLYPFQTTLLMLVPEVFEVASNLRDTKGGNMAKRVAFLEGLRKGLRNKNETAGVCLVILLRAARHFPPESESAFLSYVMDIQDELKDAVFRRHNPVGDGILFEQDLTTAACISLIHLNLNVYVDPLVQICAQPSAPLSFRVAIMQTCSYFARRPDAQDYRRLYISVSGFIQHMLKAMSTVSTDLYIGVRRSHRKPSTGDARTATGIVICNILKFLNSSPLSLFESTSPDAKNSDSFYEEIYESFVSCLVTANDTVRTLSRPLAQSILPTNGLLASVRQATPLDSESFKLKFWKLTASVLLDMCDKWYQQEDVSIIKSIHSYLESGLLLLSSCRELCRLNEDFPERTAVAIKAESLLLLALCSPEIETCQLVTSALGLLNEECQILLNESQEANVATLQLPNYEIYADIASRGFRFTGMMAFQKRTRALLRRITFPGPSILDAWERAFDKWIHLSKDVSTTPIDAIDERTFSEWRNLSGFLASLGGVCTAEQAYGVLEESVISGLKWIDRVVSEDSGEPILNRYLKQSTQLLACPNVRVRETIRDVLSTEISPPLYQPLFKTLGSELTNLFEGKLNTVNGPDAAIIFAEQAASLLRTLVEKLESPSELGAAACMDFSSVGLDFVKFLDGVTENASCLRVKIKACQLCESITKKKEHLNFHDDIRKRNQLLEYIFSWIARPRSPKADLSHGIIRQDETARLQRDLDKACFRCLASLTYKLPLQPGEGQTDAGTSELKSQMFHTYFNRFLSLLNHESAENIRGDTSAHDEAGSTSALAITILSNLLSANIDVGLKHSLSIGYHENIEIRTAFVKVLCNILVQGTEFSTLSDKAVNEKYNALLQLLTQDMSLVIAISTACPSSEVEEMTVALLNVFESRGLAFELMEALIKQEIEDTENEAELLRRNCVATKMLSIYAKWKGSNYLKSTLQKVVERLMLTSEDLDLELDPARLSSQEELQRNAMQLRIVAKVFIDDICASSTNIPPSFRKICSIISTAVMPRFQEAKYTAVGAFIFLRFFCPAIVAPESEKLVAEPPSKEMRRGLLLIAKVIQNLANNVLFGAKEPYMYPLNDFLTQNIYKVTTFLREISVPPDTLDTTQSEVENFDFGSCVVLHRFLNEHWDNIRQRLMSQGRREQIRTPNELSRGYTPAIERLRTLITTLGPPSLAITWNRPQISTNYLPTYSRFQNFMLRNAHRDTSSFMTSRTIYEGGETKDGLAVICVILRHIDREAVDHGALLFAYLKLASRLWHKPFGVFIDATCDHGAIENHDDLIKDLENLMPTEMISQLTRMYVYNMNSTYRKTFRRNLRLAGKREVNMFVGPNTEIHLLGTVQDLQTHFVLRQVHLPKETIDVVKDTRYVFQPVTRLSKTKGKIEVTIKVGSQFVQITTVKKQEVHPTHRLNAIINDIFRLSEVDEAPTSIPTEDDSAFGLRADNGKIVMYFQSSKKNEILQSIRSAKAKYGKDIRSVKSFDRLVRPQDIPGTLLNLALMNLAAPDHSLRIASYNLLGALCQAFKFKAASKFTCINDVYIPMDPNHFIINISRTLALEEPQLTADFLNEFFVGWENFSDEQKPLSLAYMAPWLPNLRTSLLSDESDSEKGKDKISAIFQKLIDTAAVDSSLCLILEQTVLPAIYKDEILLDLFLEEITKAALAVGPYDEQTQALTSTVTAIGTMTLRGKVISRLRKALNRSVLRPTKHLPQNAVWDEIVILLQFCLALSFDSGVQSQLYMPEIFHIVTMLANTGPVDVRTSVQRLLVNSLHAACTSFTLDDHRSSKLHGILELVSDPKNENFCIASDFIPDGSSMFAFLDSYQPLLATEHLAILLFDTCTVAAPSIDLANAWRSRWMSLVASTAFQNNPAIQPRAFTVMGCLAREEIDDDLLYQVLVALRHSITRFGEDGSTDMLIAVVSALSKMITKLTSASRYGLQLFWLAMSLIRLMPTARLFNCATQLLEAVLTNIGISSELRSEKTAAFLLQGRSTLEEATLPLDEVYGVHFTPDNFHSAVCACLVRGLTDPITKPSTLRVVSTFLELTTSSFSSKSSTIAPAVFYQSPYMALLQSRVTSSDRIKECLWSAGFDPASVANLTLERGVRLTEYVQDKDILLYVAIQLVDFRNLEDEIQSHMLTWLGDLAIERPAVVIPMRSAITSLLDEILLHAKNPTAVKAAHGLLRMVTTNPKFASTKDNHDTIDDFLEDMGFEGLWRSHSFVQSQEFDKQLIVLTEKLIELIIM